jgi:hypothetical protein
MVTPYRIAQHRPAGASVQKPLPFINKMCPVWQNMLIW